MPAKHTYEFVKASFESEGYVLLSREYIGGDHKLEYVCPTGHQHSITWHHWRRGKRCPYCYGNVKHDVSFIRASFKEKGYVLLTETYHNSMQKLSYKCPNGHEHQMTWTNWKKGTGCPYCSNKAKPKIKDIETSFKREGYELLSKHYSNSKTKLKYLCPNRHISSITWYSWQCGNRCSICAGNKKHTYEFIKSKFQEEGYTLLSDEYVNCKTKLKYICPMGHKHSMTFDKWNCNNRRCPTCAIINHTGPGSPTWKGGISYEDYCPIWKDKEYKESIKERDGYQCLNPDCWKKEGKLHVHHIDYDKSNCGPKNLITVCDSCNARANYQRDWHTAWYKAILYRRYNYE